MLVNAVGIQPLFWASGTLLFLADVLGLVLLGRYDFRRTTAQTAAAPHERSDDGSGGDSLVRVTGRLRFDCLGRDLIEGVLQPLPYLTGNRRQHRITHQPQHRLWVHRRDDAAAVVFADDHIAWTSSPISGSTVSAWSAIGGLHAPRITYSPAGRMPATAARNRLGRTAASRSWPDPARKRPVSLRSPGCRSGAGPRRTGR